MNLSVKFAVAFMRGLPNPHRSSACRRGGTRDRGDRLCSTSTTRPRDGMGGLRLLLTGLGLCT